MQLQIRNRTDAIGVVATVTIPLSNDLETAISGDVNYAARR